MKIDHIQLAIPENSKQLCRRFWATILGFEELEKPENLRAQGGAWFQHGSVEVHLGVEKKFRPAEKAHPAFAVAQITLLANTLTTNDYDVFWDTSIPTRRRFFTNDPAGNRIEFVEIFRTT